MELTNRLILIIVGVMRPRGHFSDSRFQITSCDVNSVFMTLLQKSLSSILCCVIVLGHAPAWLHVTTCHDHQLAGVSDDNAGATCRSSCNHLHGSEATAAPEDGLQDADNNQSHHEHDSDTCFVCQSLAQATGVVWELVEPLAAIGVYPLGSVPSEPLCTGTSHSIAQPRGPPSLA